MGIMQCEPVVLFGGVGVMGRKSLSGRISLENILCFFYCTRQDIPGGIHNVGDLAVDSASLGQLGRQRLVVAGDIDLHDRCAGRFELAKPGGAPRRGDHITCALC